MDRARATHRERLPMTQEDERQLEGSDPDFRGMAGHSVAAPSWGRGDACHLVFPVALMNGFPLGQQKLWV